MYPGDPERTVDTGVNFDSFEKWTGERTGEGEGSLRDVSLGRLLVRVGSVAEGELLGTLGEEGLLVGGGSCDRVSRRVLATEVVGDGRVVGGSVREGLCDSYKQLSADRGYEISP